MSKIDKCLALKEKSNAAYEALNEAYEKRRAFIDKVHLEAGGRNLDFWEGDNLKADHQREWEQLNAVFKSAYANWIEANDAWYICDLEYGSILMK
jgi:hypothetical protein